MQGYGAESAHLSGAAVPSQKPIFPFTLPSACLHVLTVTRNRIWRRRLARCVNHYIHRSDPLLPTRSQAIFKDRRDDPGDPLDSSNSDYLGQRRGDVVETLD